MAITPIAMQGQNAQIMLPSEAMANAERVKGMQNQNYLMSEKIAGDKRLDDLYRSTGGNINAMLADPSVGFNTGMQLQEAVSNNAANAAKAKAAKIDGMLKEAEVGAQLAGAATDQASWDAVRQHVGSVLGKEAMDRMPPQYSPEARDQVYKSALSFKDKLQLEQQDLANRRADQQMSYQNRSLDLMQARIDASERNAARNNGDAASKPPPGFRWTPDGGQEPIPGGPADIKIKGDQAKVSGAASKQMAAASQARKDAEDSNALIAQADPLFDTATGSGLGSMRDAAYAAVGSSTPGAQSAAQLKVIGGTLMSKVPKMSGPQSDADVRNYKEMAGQVGNEALPIETRRAALKAVKEINDRQIAYHDAVKAAQADSQASQETDKPSLDAIFGGQ